MGQFEQKLDGLKWGKVKRRCLDQVTGKRDDVFISKHVRSWALSTYDPPNYVFAGLCSGPFPTRTCKGIKQFPELGQSWKENHSGWGSVAGLSNVVILILRFALGSPSSGMLSPKRCSAQNLPSYKWHKIPQRIIDSVK